MSEICIAGSGGFLGSNITNYLIQHHPEYSVCSVDNLKNKSLARLQPAIQTRNRHTFYLMDLGSELISKLVEIEHPKVIIYCAVDDTKSVPENTKVLLDFIDKAISEGLKRLILCFAVGLKKDYYDLLEKTLDSALAQVHYSQLLFFIVKASKIFGSRQGPDEFLPSLLKQLLWKKESHLKPEDAQFDWVYVKDFFQNVVKFIDGSMASGSYKLLSGRSATEQDIYKYVSGVITGQDRTEIPMTVTDGNILSGQNIVWTPSFGLEDALEHTATWYHINKWALKNDNSI